MNDKNFNWDAITFFKTLTKKNKLARQKNFTFCTCSGLDGLEEALHNMQRSPAIIAVSDVANGYTELNNVPHTRRVKTVFLCMRHEIDNQAARNECFDILREVFRQFMTRLLMEKVRVKENHIYLDPRISFTEIERYFFSGCACAYFQVAVDVFTDLRFNEDEWEDTNQ